MGFTLAGLPISPAGKLLGPSHHSSRSLLRWSLYKKRAISIAQLFYFFLYIQDI